MRTDRSFITRAGLALASLALAAFLVIGFKAPEPATSGGAAATTGGNTSNGGSASAGAGTPAATGTTATATEAPASTSQISSAGTQTVTGSLIDTFYGPVQVQVTVSNGKITAIVAVQLPTGGRSGRIAQYAAPILQAEALAAQSANIDFVSGATYTSDGYQRSLQSALDQVHA